jgi:hypothetical protein
MSLIKTNRGELRQRNDMLAEGLGFPYMCGYSTPYNMIEMVTSFHKNPPGGPRVAPPWERMHIITGGKEDV